MLFKVTLMPSGRHFTVPAGATLLSAAHGADIAVPYSCRAGACRTCRGRVLQGKVDHGHVHPHYLSEKERSQGYTFLCQARPLSDLVVEVQILDLIASARRRITPARVMEIHRVAPDVVILQLKLPMNEDLVFLAGQYVEFLLSNGERRAYSIASAPTIEGTAHLELHVRHTPGGLFTDHVFNGLKVHDRVRLEAPLGTFFLREESSKPIVFLASGTGFAPIKSMLQYAAQKKMDRRIALYWGGRTRADLYDEEWVQGYATAHSGFTFVPVLSDPTPDCDWSGRTGFVHHAVMDDFDSLSGHQVYACGAPVVIESAKRDFAEKRGLSTAEFFADSFLDAADKARART